MAKNSKGPLGSVVVSILTMALAVPVGAQVMLSDGENFSEQSGEALYANVCAACHMNHGEGAMGAGKYPALTQNQNLVVGDYPVYLVLHGHTGMPPIGHMMSDDQVAAVVNYVRTNFGNNYENEVTREDVADIR